ncbi:MAG: insulinase family protein [Halieaceae bacterium]
MTRFTSLRTGLSLAVLAMAMLSACAQQGGQGAAPAVKSQLPLAPVKSPNDSKDYRYIELDNGLRALLISDPKTEKAAAALDVYVGSASNPRDRGGLAHFLEHMLFLGTDKYPDSGEYAKFISEHGGSRNAYTGFEHTNYFFDIEQASLPEALDRFAQFFISPRFDAEYVEREVNAVNAEYQLGLNTDARRNLDVMREITDPDNPYSILAVGTAETLADRPGDPVREDLLEFYANYYSANLMSLVVLGRENLDELEALVKTTFAAVPNHNVSIADIEAPLFSPGTLPMTVFIQPEASARSMMLSFPMPDYRDRYRSKPLIYIGNLLGHEGEGSLLSLLKRKGWAEALGAGSGIAYRGGAAFNINITLTEKGLQQREQVLNSVFEYVRLLQIKGPRRELYREQGQVSALQFRFRENVQPINYVSSLANDMHLLAPEDVLQGNFLMTQFEPRLIQTILDTYFVPANVLVTVTAAEVPVDRQSEYYNTPYSTQAVDLAAVSWDRASKLNKKELDPRLQLPAPNVFIAENVEVLPLAENNPKVPTLVLDEARQRIWYRQDQAFRIPKGAMYSNFRSGRVNATAADAAASQLYVSLLRDAVNEYTYPAYLAGLNFNISTNRRGISLTVSGYNDKQQLLLARIVQSIINADLDTDRFENIRADLIRNLENVKTARAFRQVLGDSGQLLLSGQYDEKDLIVELRKLDPKQVAEHASRFWSSSSVDVMLNGNYAPAEIKAVQKSLAPLLAHKGESSPPRLQVTRLAPGEDFVYPAPIEHSDAVLFWYLQAPDDSLESRALAGLSAQAVSANYFEDLRTEQQLGYVVTAFSRPLLDVPGIGFLVQSPSTSAPELLVATQKFLREQIASDVITAEQFQRHQQSLLRKILQPHKNLWEQSDYFWGQIAKRELNFDSRQKLAAAVRAITFEQWQEWFKQVLIEQPASLVVTALGQWEEMPPGTEVSSPAEFRASQPSYQRQ